MLFYSLGGWIISKIKTQHKPSEMGHKMITPVIIMYPFTGCVKTPNKVNKVMEKFEVPQIQTEILQFWPLEAQQYLVVSKLRVQNGLSAN
jgi:hypothetical protein